MVYKPHSLWYFCYSSPKDKDTPYSASSICKMIYMAHGTYHTHCWRRQKMMSLSRFFMILITKLSQPHDLSFYKCCTFKLKIPIQSKQIEPCTFWVLSRFCPITQSFTFCLCEQLKVNDASDFLCKKLCSSRCLGLSFFVKAELHIQANTWDSLIKIQPLQIHQFS